MGAKTMPRHIARNKKIAERNLCIIELSKAGVSQIEIGRRFNLTQGRISQIVRNPNADKYYEYE